MSLFATATLVPAREIAGPAPSRAAFWRAGRPRRPPAGVLAAAVCIGLALVSVTVLPSLPGFDPFAWITWGHEIAHHVVGVHEPLVLQGGPSWKPLPVAVTTIFGVTGRAAVTSWVTFVRAVGLFGVFLAYRVAARLGAVERSAWAGPLAGVLAAVAVCLTLQWFTFMLRATSEPITITATLWWVERHLAGRRLWAFSAGAALALMRPEAAILLIGYAVWCLWRIPGLRARAYVCLGVALIPCAWIGPPWLVAGKALQSSGHARAYRGNRGHDLATVALVHAENLVVVWAAAAALGLVLLAVVRRDRVVLALAGSIVAYVAIVEVMTVEGYPGLARFMLPAAAVISVLGGVGVARIADLAGGGVRSAALAAGLVAAVVALSISSAASAQPADRVARIATQSARALRIAVGRAGATRMVLPCPDSIAAVNHSESTDLAWILGVALTRVHGVTKDDGSLDHTALAFFAPRNRAVGGAPRHLEGTLREHRVLRERMWRVERVTRLHHLKVNACVGR